MQSQFLPQILKYIHDFLKSFIDIFLQQNN